MKPIRKLRALFGRKRLEAEMAEEMRAHLELRAERNRVAGMSDEDARYAARASFGGVDQLKERARDDRGWVWLEQFFQDVRLGLRALRKNPGFALVTLLTLALGIGATTAIFSVAYALVLRPLPFVESERLMAVWTQTPQVERLGMAAANHRDLQAQTTVFEDIAIYRDLANYNLIGDGEPERLLAAQVPANFFPLLRVQPVMGRGFMEEESQSGRNRVVILSHDFWQRRYGGDPGILQRTINLDGTPHAVVGVMGAGFRFPNREVQIWKPLTVNPADYQTRGGFAHLTLARLKPSISVEQAQTELDLIAAQLTAKFPAPNAGVKFTVTPLRRDLGNVARKPLIVLLGASLGLLLIGCCNLVNLLLARALTRSRETAVRIALGATRARLVRQAAAELLPLLVLGALAGVLVAKWGIALMLPWLPANLPRLEEIQLNLPVLLFSGAMLIVVAALMLLLPGVQAARCSFGEDLRGSVGVGGKATLRRMLVVGQVALTVMLLAGAGLLVRSFAALKNVDGGFRPQGVLSLRLAIPNNKYRGDENVAAFCQRILESVRTVPGVEAVGLGNRLPLGGASGVSTVQFERANQAPGILAGTDETTASPDYFRAMGVRLIQGRSFTEQDSAKAPRVIVIDEQVARQAWPGENPIGKRMRSGPQAEWAEVIGVVAHVRHESLESDRRLQIYWNYHQRARDRVTLVIRTAGEARSLTGPVLAAIRTVDANQPVYGIRTMTEVVDGALALRWFNTVVVSLFGVSSLLLAMVGIYGVIAWTVRQRTREIGVRMALGAQRHAVVGLVLRNGLKLTGGGILVGLMGALGLSRLLESLLFAVKSIDPVTFAAVPLMLFAAALLACWLPARRAAKVDPMVALRSE
jgi:putative ABC transport system permease protein